MFTACHTATPAGDDLLITIRPNRSLTRRDLYRVAWFLVVAILLVAGYAAFNGIAFALYFALAEIPLVLLLLWSAWCAGFREEIITISGHRSSCLGYFSSWTGVPFPASHSMDC